jgi:hypothetical protein
MLLHQSNYIHLVLPYGPSVTATPFTFTVPDVISAAHLTRAALNSKCICFNLISSFTFGLLGAWFGFSRPYRSRLQQHSIYFLLFCPFFCIAGFIVELGLELDGPRTTSFNYPSLLFKYSIICAISIYIGNQ